MHWDQSRRGSRPAWTVTGLDLIRDRAPGPCVPDSERQCRQAVSCNAMIAVAGALVDVLSTACFRYPLSRLLPDSKQKRWVYLLDGDGTAARGFFRLPRANFPSFSVLFFSCCSISAAGFPLSLSRQTTPTRPRLPTLPGQDTRPRYCLARPTASFAARRRASIPPAWPGLPSSLVASTPSAGEGDQPATRTGQGGHFLRLRFLHS